MIRLLTGLALGYFFYTKDGRNTLEQAGAEVKHLFKKYVIEDKKDARTELPIQKDDGRSEGSKGVCSKSSGVQETTPSEINRIHTDSDK